jgi:hypothetical protein
MDKGVKNDEGKLPYYIVFFKQFPLALKEVVRCSEAGHNKYSKTDPTYQNFSRLEDSENRYKNAALRHLMQEGAVEDMEQYGGMTHEGAVIWNFLADLEIKLRKKT